MNVTVGGEGNCSMVNLTVTYSLDHLFMVDFSFSIYLRYVSYLESKSSLTVPGRLRPIGRKFLYSFDF